MLLRASAVAALMSVASAASAQTTNCRWVGQTWTCETARGVQLDPSIIGRAFDTPQLDVAELMQRRAQIQAQQAAQQRQDEAIRQQQEAVARGLAETQQQDARRQMGGWQYTTWGMSPRQAVIASKDKVPESDGEPGQHKDGLTVGNVGSYDAGTRHFSVIFYYAAGGLYDVTLELKDLHGCPNLKEDLIGVYGDPANKHEDFIMSFYDWKDIANNNAVKLTDMGQMCSITYRPLRAIGL